MVYRLIKRKLYVKKGRVGTCRVQKTTKKFFFYSVNFQVFINDLLSTSMTCEEESSKITLEGPPAKRNVKSKRYQKMCV